MEVDCPFRCHTRALPGRLIRDGWYFRSSDQKYVQRFKCLVCCRGFSGSTTGSCYRQKKRQINNKLFRLLVSGVSLRRTAKLFKVSRTTIARKLIFLGLEKRLQNHRLLLRNKRVMGMQFDDLETFEHTKLKPLSITLAVERGTRRILGYEVSRMPAKGLLAARSRKNERASGRDRLFRRIKKKVHRGALIESDENPHYERDVKAHFPSCRYEKFLGVRGAITGQGELKKTAYDPLFSLNHTCAMFRANVNRLFRKTWCTTKLPQRLRDHLDLYTYYHNTVLIKKKPKLADLAIMST
jgi:transposase-like protein